LELFQIWLNLPRAGKRAAPHFAMFWDEKIPRVELPGALVTVIAGAFQQAQPLAPPPESWASTGGDVAIWTLKLQPGALLKLPEAQTPRWLYYFRGAGLRADGVQVAVNHRISGALSLENGAAESELLLLQGKPIGEPVVQYGPFVMNSREEIVETIREYQRTQFGGWPWPSNDPVHDRAEGRFARRPGGTVERP
jgi:redox-sensitive bicupin YhaK (pirin superfamily)